MSGLLLDKVSADLKKYVRRDRRYLLAYSGGPDSTFLLYCLYRFGYKDIIAFYVNYNDSPYVGEEKRIVETNCRAFSYELRTASVGGPSSRKRKGNFEDWAREYRYFAFATLVKGYRAEAVLVAHQQDDLICTYLMQLERGGIVTYYGIKPDTNLRGGRVVRPLLNVTKKEIVDFLNSNKIPYYDDVTNRNLSRTRNRIREEVLPQVDREKILAEIDGKNKVLQKFHYPRRIHQTHSYRFFESLTEENKRVFLHALIRTYDKDEDEKTVLSGVNLAREALRAPHSTGATRLTPFLTLYRNYGDFYVMTPVPVKNYRHWFFEKEVYENRYVQIDMRDPSVFHLKESMFPVAIRNVQEGDVFASDLPNKSVNNFLRAQKVPYYLRKTYPCLADENGKVLYVPFYEDLKQKKIPLKIKRFRL